MQEETLTVAVVSDVACPWCYIGKRNLEKALSQWKGTPITVSWYPFELNPQLPKEGLNLFDYLAQKFGDADKTEAMLNRLTSVGKTVGIDFNWNPEQRAMNTLPLHQLLNAAGAEGFKAALKERFLSAYFVEKKHLNEPDVLENIMADFGWSPEKTRQVMADGEMAYAVKQEIAHYQQMGVTGVPFFIINGTHGISGAQPPEAFLEAFATLAPNKAISEGDQCGTDGC
ncbi:DsbA family oxidoreductase [Maribacter sp. 2307ULW6-5]|uniref:DsbA family oxidoreductase n=1 Tax=Maribacter sp. 2307ULW6-5 TaxID=3386275 RepID=UPI0039BCC307